MSPAPEILVDCAECGGDGYTVHRIRVYEHGCGFAHDDTEERRCDACNGVGFDVCDAPGVAINDYDPRDDEE